MTPGPGALQPLAAHTSGRFEGLWRYVYGSANVWGSVAGLAGVALLFAGVIGRGWLLIVAGLYLLGALAAPRPRRLGLQLPEDLGPAELGQGLAQLIERVRGELGTEALALLQRIHEQVQAILPQLQAQVLSEDDRRTLRVSLARYLPETFDHFLRLPPLYRRYHVIRDGKTAERLLVEQLGVLEGQFKELGERIFRAEAQGMLAHGRFLEGKFQRPDLIGPEGDRT
ncbi:hypothetical protein D0B54_15130 [Solimonas sp. K1W22B-7]|uniref:hypothetical protein n=1 Tax=Solimonas sp. K1W22B-7 TaxID=2303331 RepID=UPI000E3311C1|nr:hypothetical protein [Solimonas sp. K1W22B-7]AXQ29929.1 hypothetical protein D0B54_15130 [Solimonas sp. K1W22B-7]